MGGKNIDADLEAGRRHVRKLKARRPEGSARAGLRDSMVMDVDILRRANNGAISELDTSSTRALGTLKDSIARGLGILDASPSERNRDLVLVRFIELVLLMRREGSALNPLWVAGRGEALGGRARGNLISGVEELGNGELTQRIREDPSVFVDFMRVFLTSISRGNFFKSCGEYDGDAATVQLQSFVGALDALEGKSVSPVSSGSPEVSSDDEVPTDSGVPPVVIPAQPKRSWFRSKVAKVAGAVAVVAGIAATIFGINLHKPEVGSDDGAPVKAPFVMNVPVPTTVPVATPTVCDPSSSESTAWNSYTAQLGDQNPATVWGYTRSVYGGSVNSVNLKVAETLEENRDQISIPSKYLNSKAEHSRVIGILSQYSWFGIDGVETHAQLLEKAKRGGYARKLADQVLAFYPSKEQVKSSVEGQEHCSTVSPESTAKPEIATDGAMGMNVTSASPSLGMYQGGQTVGDVAPTVEETSVIQSFAPMQEQGVAYDPLFDMRARYKKSVNSSSIPVVKEEELDDVSEYLVPVEESDDINLDGLELKADGTYVESDDIVLDDDLDLEGLECTEEEEPASVLERIRSKIKGLFSWGKKK